MNSYLLEAQAFMVYYIIAFLLDHLCIYIYTSCLCVRMGGIYYELKCYS
jgi:hypothetical protein